MKDNERMKIFHGNLLRGFFGKISKERSLHGVYPEQSFFLVVRAKREISLRPFHPLWASASLCRHFAAGPKLGRSPTFVNRPDRCMSGALAGENLRQSPARCQSQIKRSTENSQRPERACIHSRFEAAIALDGNGRVFIV